MLYRAYGPERRAKVARTLILPILLGPASAPILGGVLTQTLSWRWVFFINVPVGIVMVAFAWLFVPEHRPSPAGRLDWRGLLLSGAGLSALLYAISEGSVLGWASPEILVSGLAGIVLLWAFARDSLRKPDPILRLRLLRDPLLRSTNIVFALTTGVFLGSLYLTPIFLQQVMHQSPIESGTTTFLEAVGVAVGAQTLARLYPRFGPRIMCGFGGIALTVYLALFLLIDASTNLWLVRGLMFFGGLGNCGSFLAIQTSMFTHISSADTGHASAIYNTQRQSSIAINIALLTTIVAGAGGTATEAFHDAYLAAAILAAIGTVLAWTLIDTGLARPTMSRRSTPAES
jgi:predicted MFS family arabinose efflux permease